MILYIHVNLTLPEFSLAFLAEPLKNKRALEERASNATTNGTDRRTKRQDRTVGLKSSLSFIDDGKLH